jgi:hypothetical protein
MRTDGLEFGVIKNPDGAALDIDTETSIDEGFGRSRGDCGVVSRDSLNCSKNLVRADRCSSALLSDRKCNVVKAISRDWDIALES